jgi:DNA-binding NarL/FixJ family response regulator
MAPLLVALLRVPAGNGDRRQPKIGTNELGRLIVLRVAIVDDHPVARRGLSGILRTATDLTVVASVATCAELPVDESGTVAVDLVILDLYLADGRPALADIARLSAQRPVLVVSASRAPADVLAAMQSGASGYLTKHAEEEAYLTAIQAVVTTGFYLSAQLADLLQAATEGRVPATGKEEPLSPREQETLRYIARGFTHQQTATRMGVSKATVDTYIARIRTKLNLGNKAELTMAALRYLTNPPPPSGPSIPT